MARYFNADVFFKSVKQKAYPQSGSINESERKISLFSIVEILTEMPTTDVVEVVRCKDCGHWQTDWIPTQGGDDGCHYCGMMDCSVEPNNYCAYGYRKGVYL